MNAPRFTRRTFLMGTAAALAGCATTGQAPHLVSANEKLNIASIGAGGRATGHILRAAKTENLVALCDVDDASAKSIYEHFPKVAKYRDYREMLEKEAGNIDAVIIATPDHIHAPATLAAMELGKHVYCEKPLTHTVREARILAKAARRYGVVTQMGNQGHSMDGVRNTSEMIWTGAIGPVREVHCWTDRPGTFWPYGGGTPLPEQPVPPTMAWNLWIGPAPMRPYNAGYAPDNWRGWWDFGCGALGDMGCHVMDSANYALQLTAPIRVEAVRQNGNTTECYPKSTVIKYEFPERKVALPDPSVPAGTMLDKPQPPVTVYWYDGGELPKVPAGIPADSAPPAVSNGSMFIGEKGCLTCGTYGENPKLFPVDLFKDYAPPKPFLPRIKADFEESQVHRDSWLRACKGGPKPASNFDYAGPFTEWVLLGNAALRAGQPIEWDSERLRITNIAHDEQLVSRVYRKGWKV